MSLLVLVCLMRAKALALVPIMSGAVCISSQKLLLLGDRFLAISP